jgi:hypothetical protein
MTDIEFANHECAETEPIRIPTYPGSEKLATIHVCAECREWYTEDLHTNPASFFDEMAQAILIKPQPPAVKAGCYDV